MSKLPPVQTPLNQHSLMALEAWLSELGAHRTSNDPCLWLLSMPKWSAEIKLEVDQLRVSWHADGTGSECCFPYGLSRGDVETAINEGP